MYQPLKRPHHLIITAAGALALGPGVELSYAGGERAVLGEPRRRVVP